MVNFCSKCGSKTPLNSLFCENCGNQLTPSKFNQKNVNVSQPTVQPRSEFVNRSRSSRYSSPSPSTYANYSGNHYRKKANNRLGLLIGIIVIGVIGIGALSALFLGFIPLLEIIDSYEYVGSHDYHITNDNFTNLNVIIDNSIGSVNVFFEEDLTAVLDAQIHVCAKSDYDLYGSNVADVGQSNNHTFYFQFTPYSDSSWNSHYTYDLDLYISSKLSSNLQIDVSTGSIMIDARDTLIGEMFLETSTGSIEASFVNVQFNNSEYNYYQIDTSTGSVNTHFQNVTYTDDTNNPQWVISSSTGSVHLDLFQEVAINTSLIIDYDVSTSTGSVTCNFGLKNNIGYYLDASTSVGDIMVGGYSSEISLPYNSENYQNAPLKYILILSTSTGSIEIYHEP